MKDFCSEVLSRYIDAFKLFRQRRVMTLAAASSFYLILTTIPFFMLLVRTVGIFMGDIRETGQQILTMGGTLFPEKSSQILSLVEKIVEGPLFSGASFNIFNIFILLFSSLTFTNVIWNGLYLITEDEQHVSRWKYLKGLVIISITILIFCVTLLLPPIVQTLIEFIENNALMTYFQQKFPQESTILGIFESLKFGTNYIIKSNSLHASIFILYFTFLYRWFFNWKISNSQALVGTLTFVGAIFLGKLLFYSYFAYLRTNLVASYGDYYTAVVALLWIFQVMCFFFFGACLCHVLELRPLKMIPSSLLAKEVGESSKSDEVRKND